MSRSAAGRMGGFVYPPTLPEALVRAAAAGGRRGITLVHSRKRHERRGYDALLAGVRASAARLAARGVGPDEFIIVCLGTSWSWIDSWLGALWLGARPVALAPGSAATDLRRLEGLLELLGGARIVATGSLAAAAEAAGSGRVARAVVAVEELEAAPAGAGDDAGPGDPDALAFLQLTSGSTGLPRAVPVSHGAVIANVDALDRASGAPWAERSRELIDGWVSWLPLYHDMGLVGALLNAIVHGWDLCLLSPRRFVGDPALWLEQLATRGTVYATAPNFGYQLCVDRRERMPGGLDLAGWRSAMTGAEMVQAATMADFADAFAGSGFDPQCIRPGYGLAEATLTVALDQRGEGLRTRPAPAATRRAGSPTEVACVGRPLPGNEVRITGPDGTLVADGAEGEIRVRGPAVFAGYYNDPDATAETLAGGWLRTGDLGFVVDGELYITGRLKELLILRGHNLAPHEIEWLAGAVTGEGAAHRCAAFSVPGGREGEVPVVVIETSLTDPAARTAAEREVRLRLGHELKLTLADLVWVGRGQIPKTTSGKVQRHELRQRYLDGALERLGRPRETRS